MSSVQHLREFIRERLTAAAEEIFSEVEKTIVRYEEDVRLLGTYWKPQIKLSRIDLQKPHVSNEEEASAIQHLCNQGSRSSRDQEEAEPEWTEEAQMEPDPHLTKRGKPGPPWIKKEEEEPDSLMINPKWWVPKHLPTKPDQKDLCHRLKGVQHVQNQSIALIETSTLQGGDLGEEDPRAKQLSFHIFPEDEIKDQAESPYVSESQTDTKKRSLKCDICGRCCKNTHLLKQHYRTHTGEKPFSCQTCGKRFSQFGNLKVHQNVHTGKKPFFCEICGRSFSQFGNLNVHKNVHTGEKPFSCQTCGKRFSQFVHLKIHKRVHTGERPFSCQTCGKAFIFRCQLNAHQRTHLGVRPYSCGICGKGFVQVTRLNIHMKQKHKDD